MQIRGLSNGLRHTRPQAGRDRPEWVVAINRNAWSQSIGISGRNQPVRAPYRGSRLSDAASMCSPFEARTAIEDSYVG